jgi:chromosome segregation ATPase
MELAAGFIIRLMSEDSTQHFPNTDLRFLRESLQSIDTRLSSLEGRLTTLEDRVDQRLQETRPIWESVLAQLKEMSIWQSKVEEDNKDFRRMFRSAFSNLSRVQEDLEERMDRIEARPLPQ